MRTSEVICRRFVGRRLWFVHVSGSRKAVLLNVAPAEVGYMNVIPKCLDATGKYPQYENLPDTYAAINAYLTDAPLEGEYSSLCSISYKQFVFALSRKRYKMGL